MFRDRVREILATIDYDLWDINDKVIMVSDRKAKKEKMVIDWMELPCSELSKEQTRKFSCLNDKDSKYINVRYTNIERDGNTTYYDISSFQNNINDCFICSLEEDDKMYSIVVGDNGCKYREMDILDGKPLHTELNYSNHEIIVSRSYDGNSEKIKLTDSGELSFYKNDELLEEVEVDDISKYYDSIISTVDSIIERSTSYLYEKNPNLVHLMAREFPIISHLFVHRSDCYETDLIDKYLRKYDLFIHENSIKNVK